MLSGDEIWSAMGRSRVKSEPCLMDDKEFISEVGFWGFAVTVVAMLCIFFSRFVDGVDVLQSIGYTFFALLTVPFVWLLAGRYASYSLRRSSRPRVVQSAFVIFWALFTARLFFLGWPQPSSRVDMSLGAMSFVAMSAVFSGYASVRAFRRIASGQIAPINDAEAGLPASLWHSVLFVAFALFLLV